jgi:hypothetical protein
MEEWLHHSCHQHLMEMSGQLHASATLPTGEGARYPLDRRLCGRQSRSGRCGVEKNSFFSAGNRTPAVQLVACRYIDWTIPAPKYLGEVIYWSDRVRKGSNQTFSDLVNYTLKGDQFLEMSVLVCVTATLWAPSADGERGFNLINWSKFKSRYKLIFDHLDLMRNKSYVPTTLSMYWDCSIQTLGSK